MSESAQVLVLLNVLIATQILQLDTLAVGAEAKQKALNLVKTYTNQGE